MADPLLSAPTPPAADAGALATSPQPAADADAVEEALRAVWERHRGLVLERVAVLEVAVAALAEGRLDEGLRRQAERAAHQLSGTVGTFGFAAASEAAGALEQELGDPRAERMALMRALLANVRSGLSAAR